MILLLHMVGCAPDLADSGPVLPGWALEEQRAGEGTSAGIVVSLTGQSCEGCTVVHEAELAVEVTSTEATTASLRGASGQVLVERQIEGTGLLVVPLFEGCTTAPNCIAGMELHADAPVTWKATARSTSTHDAELWEPQAELSLR